MNYKVSEKVQRKEKIKNKKERKNEENPPKKKALIVTTVSGFVPQFEMNNVRILKGFGYEVHYASNFGMPAYGEDNKRLDGTGIIRHQIDFKRSPYRIFAAIKAYRQMKQLLQKYDFSLLHCHTPMGGAVARLAAARVEGQKWREKRRNGLKEDFGWDGTGKNPCRVIYTAHGFHFYKGAPLVNWMLYYPAERFLAHWTDVLVTVNKEDYNRAKKFHLRKWGKDWKKQGTTGKNRSFRKQVFLINGIGIDVEKYSLDEKMREAKRREFGVSDDVFLLLSVGELTKRKNHQVVIRALKQLEGMGNRIEGRKIPVWKYLIAGKGAECKKLEKLIQKSGLEGQVILLGYRTDIGELLAAADCFVFPSKQEGMPVALMEALAAGVPSIAADIRGCRELLPKGALVKKNRAGEYCGMLCKAMNRALYPVGFQYGSEEIEKVLKRISQGSVEQRMKKIYKSL